MSLLMQPFEFFGGLVKFDLSGLGLSDFLLKFGGLAGDLDGELLNLKGQLFDLGLISTSELLKSKVIFLLLAGSQSPLLKLLLVPVHLELELVHALVGLEDHVLNVVQSVLLVSDSLFELLDFVAQAATLSLGNLLEMLFGFNFFVLSINQTLSVYELHLNRLEMFFENLQALLMLLNFQAELGDESHLLPNDLVQFLVLIVGIGWEVLVQVVLGNSVYDVVSHCLKILNLIVTPSGYISNNSNSHNLY